MYIAKPLSIDCTPQCKPLCIDSKPQALIVQPIRGFRFLVLEFIKPPRVYYFRDTAPLIPNKLACRFGIVHWLHGGLISTLTPGSSLHHKIIDWGYTYVGMATSPHTNTFSMEYIISIGLTHSLPRLASMEKLGVIRAILALQEVSAPSKVCKHTSLLLDLHRNCIHGDSRDGRIASTRLVTNWSANWFYAKLTALPVTTRVSLCH